MTAQRLTQLVSVAFFLGAGVASAAPPQVGPHQPYSPYYPPRVYFLYNPPLPSIPEARAFEGPWGWGAGTVRPNTRYRAFPLLDESRRTPETAKAAAHVSVQVPDGAEVWFGERKTNQTGTVRRFESPPLTPGKTYAYEVTARWTEGGRAVTRTRIAEVTSGARVVVDFTQQ